MRKCDPSAPSLCLNKFPHHPQLLIEARIIYHQYAHRKCDPLVLPCVWINYHIIHSDKLKLELFTLLLIEKEPIFSTVKIVTRIIKWKFILQHILFSFVLSLSQFAWKRAYIFYSEKLYKDIIKKQFTPW